MCRLGSPSPFRILWTSSESFGHLPNPDFPWMVIDLWACFLWKFISFLFKMTPKSLQQWSQKWAFWDLKMRSRWPQVGNQEEINDWAQIWWPLGASWGVFGASWERLGPSMGPSWRELGGQHGPNLTPKTETKTIAISRTKPSRDLRNTKMTAV